MKVIAVKFWMWDFNSGNNKHLFLMHMSHSHFLIGRFQVGFMRAKLISVSKFSRKKSVGLIVLVSSPVLGTQQ